MKGYELGQELVGVIIVNGRQICEIYTFRTKPTAYILCLRPELPFLEKTVTILCVGKVSPSSHATFSTFSKFSKYSTMFQIGGVSKSYVVMVYSASLSSDTPRCVSLQVHAPQSTSAC